MRRSRSLTQAVAFPNEVEEFYNDILVLRRDCASPNDLAKVSLKIVHTSPIYVLKMFLLRFVQLPSIVFV